jgi:hypothetical protein
LTKENVTDPTSDDAVTRYPPASEFAVNIGAVAMPEASVPTSTLFEPLEENVPLGPVPGALNVTATPASGVVIGQPFAASRRTWRFDWKGVPSCAL